MSGVSEISGPGDYVILMHGLGRTRRSLAWMARHLNVRGYHVLNVGYPSRRKTLSELAAEHLGPVVDRLSGEAERSERSDARSRRIHFVTHSLGGIVLREFFRASQLNGDGRFGRCVMLAPPNQGSQILDALGDVGWVRAVLGPVAASLRTVPAAAIHRLGPAVLETGIIMGNKAVIPFFRRIITAPSDGIVPVDAGRLEGAADFIVLPVDHTFAMRRRVVLDQVLEFLRRGRFHPALC